MKFTRTMMVDEIQPRIDVAKATHARRTDLNPERTERMVNGTQANVYTATIGRLMGWPYNWEDTGLDYFLQSNAAQSGPVLYQFNDANQTLYVGKALRGAFDRPLSHVKGEGEYNTNLHTYINDNRPRSSLFTITFYALTLAADLPNELRERTVLLCEEALIKSSHTLFNVQHNQRQLT